MHIEHRDPTLKHPHAVREEKKLLVLNWLLEFQVSSRDLLATRLGMKTKTSYKLFQALVAKKLIQDFKSAEASHVRCFVLNQLGAIRLQNAGRDISHAHTSYASLIRDGKIVHALAVQAAVLPWLKHYVEVIWKDHISLPEPFEKPDILLRAPTGAWVALDYEHQRKDDNRIYMTFHNHARAIMNHHYRGVYVLFDRQADLERYHTLFAAAAWPEYDYNRKTRKIIARTTTFTPDTVPKLRQRFVFRLADAGPPAPSGARSPEAVDPAPPERPSAAGDEDPAASQES